MKEKRECNTCRFEALAIINEPCCTCIDADDEYHLWKSPKGRKPGSTGKKNKPGAGPPKKSFDDKRQNIQFSLEGKYVKKWGGIDGVKLEVIKHLTSNSQVLLGINSCASLIQSLPLGQAIQIMKSDITGIPETVVIAGELVVSLIKTK